MAKKCMIAREDKRGKMVDKYAEKRAELKALIKNPETDPQDRQAAVEKLARLPRNSSAVRLRNRCDIVKDPAESSNLADLQPERVQRMEKQLDTWIESCAESFLGSEYGKAPLERLPQQWPLPRP